MVQSCYQSWGDAATRLKSRQDHSDAGQGARLIEESVNHTDFDFEDVKERALTDVSQQLAVCKIQHLARRIMHRIRKETNGDCRKLVSASLAWDTKICTVSRGYGTAQMTRLIALCV